MIKLLCILAFLSSCSTFIPKLSPEIFYKNDLCINGICGSQVMHHGPEYPLNIISQSDMDLLTITTCHREIIAYPKKNTYFYLYKPRLEEGKWCPIYVSAYNQQGKTSFGMIATESPRHKLKAVLECNGVISSPLGVTICESRYGLKQKISFSEPVTPVRPVNGPVERQEDCPPLGEKRQVFEFSLPKRECLYQFKSVSLETFQLYTIGYEQIIVR